MRETRWGFPTLRSTTAPGVYSSMCHSDYVIHPSPSPHQVSRDYAEKRRDLEREKAAAVAAAEQASRVAADGQLERERLSAAKAAADEHARMAERGQAVAEARAEAETVRAAALGENVGRLEGRVATAEARSRELEAALQEAVAAAEEA